MQAGVLRRHQCSLLQLSSNAKSTSGSESGLGALEAPGWLTWRWQRPTGRRPGSWRPSCFRLGSPRPSSPKPSRPTPASAGPACAATGPRPSGLGRAHSHLCHQSRPPSGCWPPGGTCRSAPQGVRTLQKVLARGSAGRRGLRADTRRGNFQIVPPHTESAYLRSNLPPAYTAL